MAKQKLTKKQREARVQAAAERERRAKEAQERAQRTKKIFTIIVCVVLVLALGLPTVGLALCSSQDVQQAAVMEESEEIQAVIDESGEGIVEGGAAEIEADAAVDAETGQTEADGDAADRAA